MRKLFILLAISAWMSTAVVGQSTAAEQRIAREINHEIITLPYYGVFDSISYKVDGYKVELTGQVTRAVLVSGAERVVKSIEGVESVENKIELLPPSTSDDAIRLAVYRAVYLHPTMQRYATYSVAPIRIMVKNGRVTLEGYVSNELDHRLAITTASAVSGVIGKITDRLEIDKSE